MRIDNIFWQDPNLSYLHRIHKYIFNVRYLHIKLLIYLSIVNYYFIYKAVHLHKRRTLYYPVRTIFSNFWKPSTN